MIGFTGLKIEPHLVESDTQLCVAYRDGKRVACFYFKPNGLRFIFEENENTQVLKRTGLVEFQEQKI